MKKRISIIGNGTHSKKIQFILRNLNRDFQVYNGKSIHKKNSHKNILKTDLIFILTSNEKHFSLINKYKKKYIFCEKPPVNNSNHLKKIRKMDHKKIFFNFNRRYSDLMKNICFVIKKYKLTNLVYGNIISSKGLVFKKEYKNNWRSNIKKSPLGVFETVTIHNLDLINKIFKIKKITNLLVSHSKINKGIDTSYTNIVTNNNAIINIISTYSSSLNFSLKLYFNEGIINYDGKNFIFRYPTKTFNKKGFFLEPHVVYKKKINFNSDNDSSLKKSIKYFLKLADKNKIFSKKDFNISLKTNELILNS